MKQVRFRDWDWTVEKLHYGNGRVALQLIDAVDGEPIATATVNLPDIPAEPDEVFIRDFSENEGMLAALAQAGVVQPTGEIVRSGFIEVPRVKLLPLFRDRTYEKMLADIAVEGPGDLPTRGNDRSRQIDPEVPAI
jgi:hypothetical protein